MDDVKRYGHIGYLVTATPHLMSLYSDMKVYVSAEDFDTLTHDFNTVVQQKMSIAQERDQLKAENEAMRAGIDPKWGLMDQSILVDYLREQTNFCADKFDGMIQFAVDAANREFK